MQGNLPENVTAYLAGEPSEFIVKSKRDTPIQWMLFPFSLLWLSITGFMLFMLITPLLSNNEVNITVNGVHKTGSLNNMGPLIFPFALLSVFIVIGIGMLFYATRSVVKQGSWYIGTKSRLVIANKKSIRSLDWEQFTGDIQVTGNDSKGTIEILLRTGKMHSRKNGPDEYVADSVYISGIQNAYEIEKIMRKRIKENDPTPAVNDL